MANEDTASRAITYRPSPETRKRIGEIAQSNIWSMNVAVEQLVREALAARAANQVHDGSTHYDPSALHTR